MTLPRSYQKITHRDALNYRINPVFRATYGAWAAMLGRCRNPKLPNFPPYGGRGITVCARWLKFENFLADMGPKPSPDLSLDRIDNNGNYEPSNCRWATPFDQANNRRSTVKIEYLGRRLSVHEWAREVGLKPSTLRFRLDHGIPLEEALIARPRLRGRFLQAQAVANG